MRMLLLTFDQIDILKLVYLNVCQQKTMIKDVMIK